MKKIITGISVEEQQRKAKLILDEVVIPRELEFQKRRKNGTLNI